MNPDDRIFRALKTPAKIQAFLDEQVAYNKAVTCYGPRMVLRHHKAHCMEGALLAASALRRLGHEPLLVDLTAVRDDDHVLAVFRERGCWGAVAKSNYAGLRFRNPVYRTVRELAMSYFEHYYNLKGEKTLRGYSRPVRLARFDALNWMTTEEEVWEIPTYLCTIPHAALMPSARIRYWMDERLYAAGRVGMQE